MSVLKWGLIYSSREDDEFQNEAGNQLIKKWHCI